MRNLMLVCSALAITSSIVSLNLWRDLRAERELNSQLRERPENSRSPAPALTAAPLLTTPAKTENVSVSKAQLSTPAAAVNLNNLVLNERDMLKDPEYRKARLAQIRLSLPQTYPGLAEALGLSPQEADKLFDLLAKNQMEMQANTPPIVNGQSDQQAVREMDRVRQDAQQRLNDSLLATLGDSRYRQWQDYQETRPGRQRAVQLSRTMEAIGEPMSDAQMRPLTTALVAEQKRQRDDMQAMVHDVSQFGQPSAEKMQEESFKRQAESNRRVIEAATPYLSARQLGTLKETLDQQLAMSRASSRMQRDLQGQSTPIITTGVAAAAF